CNRKTNPIDGDFIDMPRPHQRLNRPAQTRILLINPKYFCQIGYLNHVFYLNSGHSQIFTAILLTHRFAIVSKTPSLGEYLQTSNTHPDSRL
ncbi:MAG: hypothetical protein H6Q37_1575, partial [Chloroflexi bacterium]|nr:hypothetical protein [Chloroflexota bacterium]